jgi:hypothetical protein
LKQKSGAYLLSLREGSTEYRLHTAVVSINTGLGDKMLDASEKLDMANSKITSSRSFCVRVRSLLKELLFRFSIVLLRYWAQYFGSNIFLVSW